MLKYFKKMASAARVAISSSTATAAAASYLSFRSLTFLGTSSGTPTTSRNVSSYALTLSDGAVWLFDAGEGTQHQLLKCQNVSRGSIDKIFVTHLHGDHSFGLPGLMCSTSLTWTPPTSAAAAAAAASDNDEDEDDVDGGPRAFYPPFSKRSQYLELIGPVGLAAYLRSALISSESRFPFQYRVTELIPPISEARRAAVRGVLFPSKPNTMLSNLLEAMRHPDEAEPLIITPNNGVEGDDTFPYLHYNITFPNTPQLTVQAAALNHRTFCVGYAITEQDAPGTLLMEKVTALGVPKGPLLSQLKSGAPVTFNTINAEDGTVASVTVAPDQVVGPSAPGRRVVLLGDTCDSPHMASLLQSASHSPTPASLISSSPRGVDWVVHESTFNMDKQDLAIPRGHSTTRMAGAFAAQIHAKNLILTHFSARYPSSEKDPEAMESLRAEAQAAAGSATLVHVADDFKVFDLERKKVAVGAPPTKKK
ncbi:beta lactamase-like protein, putative [Bodo saltans]|uniref:Beta lactamase-like protein, putative n=1 Tax=Bodo saltans TaxID=75058 RepID=A0A0S4IP71_BODSA|nr:beta lactamase-like protein, putative [Bodo saltans]|eukprot:CUE94812.1 beta lactamase-like protein, putative [Bodo saltans]